MQGTKTQKWRMLASKLMVLPILGLALFTHHVYAEEGLIDVSLEVTGFVLVLISALGRVWASAHISGKKTRKLVTDGPYSITRNPLYFFSFLGFLGSGLVFESLTLAAVLVGVFYMLHWPTILAEEKHLHEVFGTEFEDYMKRVPRFFPRSLKMEFAETLEFSPKSFSRSVVECGLVAFVFIIAHVVEWCQIEGILPVFFYVP